MYMYIAYSYTGYVQYTVCSYIQNLSMKIDIWTGRLFVCLLPMMML